MLWHINDRILQRTDDAFQKFDTSTSKIHVTSWKLWRFGNPSRNKGPMCWFRVFNWPQKIGLSNGCSTRNVFVNPWSNPIPIHNWILSWFWVFLTFLFQPRNRHINLPQMVDSSSSSSMAVTNFLVEAATIANCLKAILYISHAINANSEIEVRQNWKSNPFRTAITESFWEGSPISFDQKHFCDINFMHKINHQDNQTESAIEIANQWWNIGWQLVES